MTYFIIPALIFLGLFAAWLSAWVGEAIVEPINPKNGLIQVKLRARKRRWQKIWDEWVGVIMFTVGLFIGFWMGWML